MALQADGGMKFLPELDHLRLITLQEGDLMEAMAIAAIRRIGVSCNNGFAVGALQITVIRMAGRAFFNDPLFFPFPGGHIVNIFVAVFTLNIIYEMGACVMLCPFFLMTAMAGHRFRMNPRTFGLRMRFHVRNVPVAAIAGVGSMD
jgi:hypothetical protein